MVINERQKAVQAAATPLHETFKAENEANVKYLDDFQSHLNKL